MTFLQRLPRAGIFWPLCIVISFVCAGFAFKYFSHAFPLFTIDLRMNRSGALKKGEALANQYHWGPDGPQQTASFATDTLVKTFVELAAGGKTAFVDMMKKRLYLPYTWQTRHFKEFNPHEVTARFTPEGIPYGFVETLSENAPGPDLPARQAQQIAEKAATQNWKINLEKYELIEASKEARTSGRTDHTFVYQRPDIRIGQGYYRLRLRVSGDKFTELTHFVHVPEAFLLRYREMRSANISIASAASMAVTILYVLLGCIVGLFFLLRTGWSLWRVPLFWGIVIGVLQFFVALNRLPFLWSIYDTALPMNSFLLQYIINNLYSTVYSIFSFTLAFMAAESLTRKAFGHHPRLWNVWSKKTAGSLAILGRTIGGYLMVPLMFAYVVALYAFAQKFLGWWTPSEQLLDPNILSNYLPWFSSLAISFKAGFWEECLFRAVPLSAAALLGKRFGKKKWWIIGAFILQAVIFGAAHASYPAQPAYARLVELILPSFMFGGIYLVYGLLPSVIMHVIYDVVWFALPLFISTAPGAWINQLLVIFFSLIPLFIIAYARLRNKKWTQLTDTGYNHSWKPEPEQKIFYSTITQKQITFSPRIIYAILAIGTIGVSSWFAFTRYTQNASRLTISRKQGLELANQTIQQKYKTALTDPWVGLSGVQAHFKNTAGQTQHRFIWQEGGQELYKKYLGSYLTPPHWLTRFVKFTGPLVDRAEEYQTFVARNSIVFRTRHQLPETAHGAQLEKAQAGTIAQQELQKQFSLDHSKLKEVSAVAFKRPARKDWLFEFADEKGYPLKEGQARIAISIAGDQVNDAHRYIHVPEEWDRAARKRNHVAQIVKTLCSLFIYILFLIGLGVALVRWSMGGFSARTFLYSFLGIFGLFIISVFNAWPQIIARFNTSEPFFSQVFRTFGFGSIYCLIRSAVIGLVVALTMGIPHRYKLTHKTYSIFIGVCLGVFIAGAQVLLKYFGPSVEPLWADYTPLGNIITFVAPIVSALTAVIFMTALFLLLCNAIDQLTSGWKKNRLAAWLVLILFTLVITGLQAPAHILFWLISGSVLGITIAALYHFVIRFDHALIPLITGTVIFAGLLQQVTFNAYPNAHLANIFASLFVLLLAIGWWKKLG